MDASPDAYLAFAKRYSILKFCEHWLPDTHRQPPFTPNEQWKHCELLIPEPLSLWRVYAQQVRGILAVAARLHRGESGRDEDWLDAWGWSEGSDPEEGFQIYGGRGLTVEREALGQIISTMLDYCGVGMSYQWRADDVGPVVRIGGGGALGMIVRNLAFTVARTDGLSVCSGCGRAYIPSRRPRAGELNWCSESECVKKAKAERQRRWRKNKKGAE